MNFLNCMDVSASGLTAQRLRMDTIASNMANVETTRTADGKGPYKRQVVLFEARGAEPAKKSFHRLLRQNCMAAGNGVRVAAIKELNEDEAPFRKVYDPSHPDADQEGYVSYPNVNIVEEMINMISANRAYEANAQVIEASKSMAMRALNIGK